MRYVVLNSYINRDGELVDMAEIVELENDKFTEGLIKYGFITKSSIYDEARAMVTKIADDLFKMCSDLIGDSTKVGEQKEENE